MGDLGSIPGLGRCPGEGKGLPTPVFWPGEFHGLAKNRTQLSDFHFHFSLFGIARNVESHKAKLRDKKGTVVFV